MLAIGAVSLLPEEIKAKLHTHGPQHSTLHILAFTAMAYFAFRSVRSLRAHVLLIEAGIALGLGSELAEHLFYGAPLEYRDIAADCIGVLFGSSLAAVRRRRRTLRASHPVPPHLTS